MFRYRYIEYIYIHILHLCIYIYRSIDMYLYIYTHIYTLLFKTIVLILNAYCSHLWVHTVTSTFLSIFIPFLPGQPSTRESWRGETEGPTADGSRGDSILSCSKPLVNNSHNWKNDEVKWLTKWEILVDIGQFTSLNHFVPFWCSEQT